MSTTEHDAESIVDAYHRAWTGGDVDRALTPWSPTTSGASLPNPLCAPKTNGASIFPTSCRCSPALPNTTGWSTAAASRSGTTPQTAVTTTTLASELFTVRDGLIVEVRLAVDRLGYVPDDIPTA